HTVDVVVAMDGDPVAVGEAAPDTLHRAFDPGEGGWRVTLASLQKLARGGGIPESPARENLGQDVADAELALECQRRLQVIGGDLEPGGWGLRPGRRSARSADGPERRPRSGCDDIRGESWLGHARGSVSGVVDGSTGLVPAGTKPSQRRC